MTAYDVASRRGHSLSCAALSIQASGSSVKKAYKSALLSSKAIPQDLIPMEMASFISKTMRQPVLSSALSAIETSFSDYDKLLEKCAFCSEDEQVKMNALSIKIIDLFTKYGKAFVARDELYKAVATPGVDAEQYVNTISQRSSASMSAYNDVISVINGMNQKDVDDLVSCCLSSARIPSLDDISKVVTLSHEQLSKNGVSKEIIAYIKVCLLSCVMLYAD